MDDVIAALKSFWLLWLIALFVGIVAWAYAPRRKRRLQDHGSIPLRDED
jgi:cytochrome c oxidase cbb3-type subunit 4